MNIKYTNRVLELKGRVHWQSLISSYKGIQTFVEELEERTGLKFMARKEGDTLNGFVTKFPEGFIVSIYGVDKKPDEESPYAFKAVKVTKEMEEKIYASSV